MSESAPAQNRLAFAIQYGDSPSRKLECSQGLCGAEPV